ncbi:hypothetical protein, partial [Methyloversatilis discipulorum]|uniref:hypothetical protein n=1 Tax=Methyloversatilis discipulorum TaxID=1119528 RepID=UPI003F34E44C
MASQSEEQIGISANLSHPVITVLNAVASEADGYMDFVVTLSAPSDQLVSVNYVTESDTASSSSNTDFSV